MDANKFLAPTLGIACLLAVQTIFAAAIVNVKPAVFNVTPAVFNVTPDRYSVLLAHNGTTELTTTVTNASNRTFTNIYFDAGYQGVSNATMSVINGGTCVQGESIASGQSCTFVIEMQAGTASAQTTMHPRFCANSGSLCSQSRKAVVINTSSMANTVSITGSATTALPSSSVVSTAYPVTFTFTNNDTTHPANGVYISNTYPTGFSETSNTCGTSSSKIQLNASQSCTVSGTYTPTMAGSATVEVALHSVNSSDVQVTSSTTTMAQQVLYVPNSNGNRVSKCDVEANGDLASCGDSGASDQLSGSHDVKLNPAGTIAYITYGFINELQKCDVNSDGALSSCADAGATSLVYPESITFNASGTLAYIVNRHGGFGTGPAVLKCDVSGMTGALSNCVEAESSTSGLLESSIDLVFNADGSQAFITNLTGGTQTNGAIVRCTVNQSGSLTNCTKIETSLYCPFQLAFNSAHTKAYIGQGCSRSSIHVCDVDGSGNFSNCAEQGSGFSSPLGVSLNSGNTSIYVASNGSDMIYKCALSSGNLGSCSEAVSGITPLSPFMIDAQQ